MDYIATVEWEQGTMWLISGIVLPCVAWLIKEVLKLRNDFIKFQSETEQRMCDRDKDCQRHNEWTKDIQKTVTRSDRNVVRICEAQGVEYEKE